MKRMPVILTLLAVILAAGIFSLVWLNQYTGQLAGELGAVAQTAEQSPEEALRQMEAVQENWHQTEHKIGLFVHEELLRQISEKIEECAVLLQLNRLEEFQTAVRTTIFAVKNLAHQEMPTLENIF